MKGSLLILALFIVGALLGRFADIPDFLTHGDFTLYALLLLMFSIGLGIGYDKELINTLRKTKAKILLVPLATLVGTLIGASVMSIFIPNYSLTECLAVGSGMGYYSVSSILITQYKTVELGAITATELGTIALLSNIIRELFTIVAAPLLVMWFGKLAPICAAGVTSIDTALPSITRYSGPEFAIIAIFHGITFEVCIPLLVSFFCWL